MIHLLVFPLLVAAATLPDEVLTVTASITAEKLKVGRTYEIVVEAVPGKGLSASSAGLPAPILQLQPPRSVKLVGKTLKKYKDLAANEFLRAPFERMLSESPTHVEFKLRRKPREGDEFHLNVLAYVSSKSGEDAVFVRRRLVLALAPGASATVISSNSSDWGQKDFLQLGDKAATFKLPRADGTEVALEQYLGKSNVIVTTYRAFW